ncbi:MAG: sigma-70 family RNA polymerase sigma factor [Candidatus Omnitrophota bacterium]
MDAIKLYLKDIKNIPLLTPEEERKFAKKARAGDSEARKKMIQSNLRLVINIAKRYNYFGVPMLDLIEEGNLGLMKAVSKFNANKGYRFSTYASWWIKQHITRAMANQGKTIRIPVYLAEIIARWRKVIEKLSHKLHRSPRPNEIAKEMKLPIWKIREISEVAVNASSLDAPIGEDGEAEFMDIIEDESSSSPVNQLSKIFQQESVRDLLKSMNEREHEILNLRFGLKDGTAYTLGETAKKFNITRERVRQIENAAMRKLRLLLATQEGIIISDTTIKRKKEKHLLRKAKKSHNSARKRKKSPENKAKKKKTVKRIEKLKKVKKITKVKVKKVTAKKTEKKEKMLVGIK